MEGVQMDKVTFEIRGVRPLLMHNGQLADPLNEYAIALAEVSKKKDKTQADHEEMGRIEFLGSLYLNGKGLILPAENLMAMVVDGAKARKLGSKFKGAIQIRDDAKLQYKGPSDPEKLWEDKRFVDRRAVRIGRAKVMRTRPIFEDWSATFTVHFENVNRDDVINAVRESGEARGSFEMRPRYGRFEIVAIDGKKQE